MVVATHWDIFFSMPCEIQSRHIASALALSASTSPRQPPSNRLAAARPSQRYRYIVASPRSHLRLFGLGCPIYLLPSLEGGVGSRHNRGHQTSLPDEEPTPRLKPAGTARSKTTTRISTLDGIVRK